MALMLCALLIPFTFTLVAPSSEGFTMKLIHRYSDGSPYYNPNLNESQIMQKLIQQSRSYIKQLEPTVNISGLRPPISKTEWNYLVKLRIGTKRGIFRSGASYYLDFDTGSSLTWTQCKPCNPCFQQPTPTFDPKKSPTYKPVPRNHHLCTPPFRSDRNGNCRYEVYYADGTSTEGVLSTDTFAFKSEQSNREEAVQNLVFGCSHWNNMQHHTHDNDGTLGMGRKDVSVLKQMLDRTGGRFSYCLVKQLNGPSGFLRFGNAPLRGSVQRTPFEGPISAYFLTLNDITIANRRLNLPPGTFARHSDDDGGCILDTGTAITKLIKPAYDRVVNELIRYFNYYHLQRTHPFDALEICYRTPGNYQTVLPQMVLHFHNADYHIGWENLFFFHIQQDSFCFAVLSSNEETIIGAYQQHNMRLEYNLVTNALSFVPEDCARDAGR